MKAFRAQTLFCQIDARSTTPFDINATDHLSPRTLMEKTQVSVLHVPTGCEYGKSQFPAFFWRRLRWVVEASQPLSTNTVLCVEGICDI